MSIRCKLKATKKLWFLLKTTLLENPERSRGSNRSPSKDGLGLNKPGSLFYSRKALVMHVIYGHQPVAGLTFSILV